MSRLRLAVFDCDGTLIDSLHAILHAMNAAFESCGLEPPPLAAVRGIVGLSVPEAVRALAPDADPAVLQRLDRRFREESLAHRAQAQGTDAPLYPGAKAALERLDAAGHLMAIATGKARRGLDYVCELHGIARHFVATQTADDAPSKPHPGMLENCERLTGVAAEDMVMIGDTSFDMQMARAHGCAALGVSWGYHDSDRLYATGADLVIDSFAALDDALADLWRRR